MRTPTATRLSRTLVELTATFAIGATVFAGVVPVPVLNEEARS